MSQEFSNEYDFRTLEDDFPVLHGQLLCAHERIDNVSSMMIWVQFLLASGFCILLSIIDWQAKLGVNGGWSLSGCVYVLIILGCTLAWSEYDNYLELCEYNSLKHSLFDSVDQCGINRSKLISMLQNKSELEKISRYLKADKDFVDLRPF